MFYMPGRSRGLWMIGPQIGKFSGGLANRGDEVCPENLRRSWKFANGRGWVVDSKVNITCINSESGNSINTGVFCNNSAKTLIEQLLLFT